MDCWDFTQYVGQKDRRKERRQIAQERKRTERNKGRVLQFDSVDAFLSSVFTPTTQVHPYTSESLIYNTCSSLTGSFTCCSTRTKRFLVTVLRTSSHSDTNSCSSVLRKMTTEHCKRGSLPIWWARSSLPETGAGGGDVWSSSFKNDQDPSREIVLTCSLPAFAGEWNKWCFRLQLPGDMKVLLVKCMISQAIHANWWKSLKWWVWIWCSLKKNNKLGLWCPTCHCGFCGLGYAAPSNWGFSVSGPHRSLLHAHSKSSVRCQTLQMQVNGQELPEGSVTHETEKDKMNLSLIRGCF